MYRKIEEDLKKWQKDYKMPLMLIGVKQSGKTYILEKFCQLPRTKVRGLG